MNSPGSLSSWVEASLGFVYPARCQLCEAARATAAEGFVCPACYQRVRFVKPPFCERCGLPFEGNISAAFNCTNCREMELHFSSARSAVLARDVVLDVIHRFKYNRALWFEPFLAGLLIRAAAGEISHGDWDCLVPVPLHATREREREFNQSRRLANRLGKSIAMPVRSRWLRRVEPTRSQTSLSRKQRAANVRHAFACARGLKLDGERIVLIDDVFTTGATTSACARVLKAAGAGDVCVWTVARGI